MSGFKGSRQCRTSATARGVSRAILAVAMASVLAIAPSTIATASGPIIIGKSKPKTIASGGKCVRSQANAESWISKTVVMQRLNQAYRKAIEDMDGLDAKDFHYKGGRVGGYWKDQAIADIKKSGQALLSKAEKYASRLIKACDVCDALESWAILLDVARAQNPTQFVRFANQNIKIVKYKSKKDSTGNYDGFERDTGSNTTVDLSSLTEEQASGKDSNGVPLADDKSAIFAARKFIKLHQIKSAVVLRDDDVGVDETVCAKNLGKAEPTAGKCAPYIHEQHLNYWSNEVVDRLYAATKRTTEKMTKKLKAFPTFLTDCPGSLFKDSDLGELRRFQ